MAQLSEAEKSFVKELCTKDEGDDGRLKETKLLSLWAIHKATWKVAMRRLKSEDVADPITFLRRHTGIYRMWGADAKPGEDWPAAEECLAEMSESKYNELVKRKLVAEHSKDLRKNPSGGSECFSFDLYCWESDSGEYQAIDLHFDNMMAPLSPFKHSDVLRAELKAIAKQARECKASFIFCVSWLNCVPQFLDLFPASYKASAVPMLDTPPDASALTQPKNWFVKAFEASTDTGRLGLAINRTGQFVQADWTIREKSLQQYVVTGQFPSECMICVCPSQDFIDMYAS